jgi:hypothetical protein
VDERGHLRRDRPLAVLVDVDDDLVAVQQRVEEVEAFLESIP